MTRRAGVAACLAVLVAAPFFFARLGSAPFDDPGEGMHAEIARELLASGDVVSLTLNGVRYVDKPPLLYALLASAFSVAGPSEWSARLVPALAALAAVGATAWLGARLAGLASGLLSGLALASSIGFFVYGRYVRPETLLVAALAAGFALLLIGVAEDRRWLVVAGLAAFGIAGLAKDPLAALLPPAAIGIAQALAGHARPVSRWLPWPGVIAWLVLGLGWWAIAAISTPGFTWYTVVDNHVLNVLRARRFPDEDVPLSVLEFLVVALTAAFPWIIGAAITTIDLIRRRAWRDPRETAWTALAIWAVGVLALTAVSPFRLPHYGLPAYPMIALLSARAWLAGPTRRVLVLQAALFAGIGAACLFAWRTDGAAFTEWVMTATDVATRKQALLAQEQLPWDALRPIVGATALVFLAGAALTTFAIATPGVRTRRAVAIGAVVSTALTSLPPAGEALALVATHRAVRPVALVAALQAGPADALVHEGPIENSGALEWYASRRPGIVHGEKSVLAFGATLDGAAATFWTSQRLAQAWGGQGRVWLVSARSPDASVARTLPGATLVTEAGGRRLYVNRVQ